MMRVNRILGITVLALLISSYPILLVHATNNNLIYIVNNSPQYSILQGSSYLMPVPPDTNLSFAIILNFTNYTALMKLTDKIVNHQANYLSPAQFRQYFYPPQSYVQSLINYLSSYGIKLTGNYGLVLTFNGTVGQIEKAFHTYINFYLYPYISLYWYGLLGIRFAGIFLYYSNNVTPSLPYDVGKYVIGIIGLNSIDPQVYPLIKKSWNLAITPLQSGSSLVSQVIVEPKAIAGYFNFTEAYKNGWLGQGVTIGIIGVPESCVNVNDIYAFWNKYSIIPRTGSLNVITFGNITINGQSAEAELDAEYAGIFAPAANIVLVFSNGYVGGKEMIGHLLNYYYEYYYMINYVNPQVISVSVEAPESFLGAYYPTMLWALHNLMIQAAVQGISVVAASGDFGFESDYYPPILFPNIQNTLWYPSSDPYVTSIGGIFVNVNNQGNITNIVGWSYSGGGISMVFKAPSYQKYSKIPFTPIYARTNPDLAFVAAGGYNIPQYGYGLPLIFNGSLSLWWGTSGSAPMTAAMIALTGERLGALNYIIYNISYSGKIYTPKGVIQGIPPWIIVTTGYNPFPATYGWNFVVGIGTYNAYAMVKDLKLYMSTVK